MPRSPCDPARCPGPRRTLRGESEGVTEVIGFMLIFGILSMILILSLLAFGVAQEGARERSVEVRAESVASRVAGIIVQAALIAEDQAGRTPAIAYRLDLPTDLEGEAYVIAIEPAAGAEPDQVRVEVPGMDFVFRTPVFSAAASSTVDLCATEANGGPIYVRLNGGAESAIPAPCVTDQIFLEEA